MTTENTFLYPVFGEPTDFILEEVKIFLDKMILNGATDTRYNDLSKEEKEALFEKRKFGEYSSTL